MASIRRIKEAAAFQVGLSKSSDGIDSPDLYGCGGNPHESHACVESSQTYIKEVYRSYKRHPEYNSRLHGFLLPRKMRHLLVRLDIRKIPFNSATFLPKKKNVKPTCRCLLDTYPSGIVFSLQRPIYLRFLRQFPFRTLSLGNINV